MPQQSDKVFALVTVLLGMFIAAMESLIGSTILPSIISSLGGLHLYPWLISCFLLALIVATPLFGTLADTLGFFKVYYIALIFFSIGSFLCGVSQSMIQLILARIIQGIGTAGLITLCLLYVGIAYPLSIRHKMQALISSMWALASLLGPSFGAFIVAYTSWRFAFLINLPLCILIALGTFFFLKNIPSPKNEASFDLNGAFIFTLASLTFLYSIVRLGNFQFASLELFLLITSFAFFGLLIRRGSSNEGAFLSLSPLKKQPIIATAIGLGFLGGAFLFATANFLPFFVQGVQGGSIKAVGQVVTGMALGTCAGSFITALILSQIGFRSTALIGSFFLTSGIISLILLTEESSLFMVTLANFLTGVGIGISANGAIVATQSFAPSNRLGLHTSLFSFFRNVGGMLAISLIGALQLGAFRREISENVIGLHKFDALEVLSHPESFLDPSRRLFLSEVAIKTLALSLQYSLHLAFLTLVPLLFIHIWLSSKMPNIRPHEISLPKTDAMGE